MIDPLTGRIRPEGLDIDRDLTKTAFLAATSMPSSEWLVRGEFWYASIVRPWQGQDWNFTLTYVGEVLQSVGMGYAKRIELKTYSDWEAFERDKLSDYEGFLKTWLGDWHRKFPWGKPTVYFDERGVGSGIFVEYRVRST